MKTIRNYIKKVYINVIVLRNRLIVKTRKNNDKKIGVIASLTSYPARYRELHYVIESILAQSVRPDAIYLYLDKGEIIDELPDNILALRKYGLRIEVRDEPLKPHKKYLYAVKEHPESIVITFDDDHLYPLNTIFTLYNGVLKHPHCVATNRAHQIFFYNDRPAAYELWTSNQVIDEPRNDLLATGVSACAYPPNSLNMKYLDPELILKNCLNADDIWLKFVEIISGTKVVVPSAKIWKKTVGLDSQNTTALMFDNVGSNKNDEYFQHCLELFNLDESDFQ